MEIREVLGLIGEQSSGFMSRIIQFLSTIGLNLNNTQGKILNLLIVVGLALGILKIMTKPIKWLFVTLLVLLALSIGLSFIQ